MCSYPSSRSCSCTSSRGGSTSRRSEWDEIRADLDALYEVEVQSGGKTYLLRSKLQGICGKVFKAVGVAIPPSAMTA